MKMADASYHTAQLVECNTPKPNSSLLGKRFHAATSALDAAEGLPFGTLYPTPEESARLLRIVWQVSQIRHHYELFLLLQGAIQHFISHQLLISAWGDFRNSHLTLDVVSALPNVRTDKVNGCGADLERMLRDLRTRWVANDRRKMLLNSGMAKAIMFSDCNCPLHKAMRGMRSILVHGVHDKRDEIDSIYLALDPDSVVGGRNVERFFQWVDPVVSQIDLAFRNVTALKSASSDQSKPASRARAAHDLSSREQEVIKWVAAGKTNVEIGPILGISSFTVKNHVQRIFRKLGASNRTEAVSKYNQV